MRKLTIFIKKCVYQCLPYLISFAGYRPTANLTILPRGPHYKSRHIKNSDFYLLMTKHECLTVPPTVELYVKNLPDGTESHIRYLHCDILDSETVAMPSNFINR